MPVILFVFFGCANLLRRFFLCTTVQPLLLFYLNFRNIWAEPFSAMFFFVIFFTYFMLFGRPFFSFVFFYSLALFFYKSFFFFEEQDLRCKIFCQPSHVLELLLMTLTSADSDWLHEPPSHPELRANLQLTFHQRAKSVDPDSKGWPCLGERNLHHLPAVEYGSLPAWCFLC